MLKTAKSYLLYKKHLTQKSADDKIRSLAASQPRSLAASQPRSLAQKCTSVYIFGLRVLPKGKTSQDDNHGHPCPKRKCTFSVLFGLRVFLLRKKLTRIKPPASVPVNEYLCPNKFKYKLLKPRPSTGELSKSTSLPLGFFYIIPFK